MKRTGPEDKGPGMGLKGVGLPAFAPDDAAGPLVVAIEGANGAGKTTLSRELALRLGAGWCLGTDEAWFSEAFKVRMIRDADWYASAMFFLSGCFEQMRVLRGGSQKMVIMDRCLWSTLAVHAAQEVERLGVLVNMLQPIAPQIRVPQVTIVLEASFETCQSRIALKSGTARALDELTANPDFHERERQFYRWLAAHQNTVTFLDVNNSSIAEVAQQALNLIGPMRNRRGL